MEEEVIAEVQGEEEEINSVDIHEMPILPPSGDSFLFETTSPRLDITSYIIAPPPPPPLDFFNITYESIAATIPWEDLYQSEARTSYKDSVLVEFPKDNIAIETFPKFHKNDYSAKPAPEYEDKLDPYVKVCFWCFSADWKLLRFQYFQYQRKKTEHSVFDLPHCNYIFDKSKRSKSRGEKEIQLSSNDPHFSYIKPFGKSTDSTNEKKRNKGRLELFEYYDPKYAWQPGSEIALCNRIQRTSHPETKSAELKSFFFKIQPKSLVFQFGQEEPLFYSFALYDAKNKKKLSETYHVVPNSDVLLNLLGHNWYKPAERLPNENGLFRVTSNFRHQHMYLVLSIEKVLQGDPEQSVEPYAKVQALTSAKIKEQEKNLNKIRNEVEDYCKRLGKYRQPFGWSALPVFDQKGNLVLGTDSSFSKIWARNPKDDIFELLDVLATPDSKESKKLGKDLFGICSFSAERVMEEDLDKQNLADSSLQMVRNNKGELGSKILPVTYMVHEFPQFQSMVTNFYYINNMYIYPIMANLSNKNGRNITIKMEVKDNDSDPAESLCCIFSPSNPTGFLREIYTHVQYHNKTPSYYLQEFKILLPPKLSEKHHLLFTFFHITCAATKKKGAMEPVETILGYAVVPLYPNRRIVVHNLDGQHGVPIINRLESGYLTKIPPELKPSFFLRFELISTIYPQDLSITQFLNVFHTSIDEVSDDDLVAILKGLQGINEFLAIQYLPVIINNLLEVLVSRENHPPKLQAFKTLVLVLHKVSSKLSERTPRNSLLELYSNYIFDQTLVSKAPVYTELVSNFLLYMMDKRFMTSEEKLQDSVYPNSWFIFNLIIKSMILDLHNRGKLYETNRKDLFSDDFTRVITHLLEFMTKHFIAEMNGEISEEIRLINRNLALFIKDLFAIYDRGIVLDIIRKYLERMTDNKQQETILFKFEFLQIITDHEHYMPLNLPFEELDSANVNLVTLSKMHPLATIMMYEVFETLKSDNIKGYEIAIKALYDIIVKNAFDERYYGPEKQEVVARVYLFLLPLLVENWRALMTWRSSASVAEKRELYICLLFVLKSANRSYIRAWWKSQILNHTIFFQILADIIVAFDFSPDHKRPTRSLLTDRVAIFMTLVGTEEMTQMLKSITNQNLSNELEDHRLRHLTVEVYLIILDIVENFIEDFKSSIDGDGTVQLKVVAEILTLFMKKRLSETFAHHLYATLRSFVCKFKTVLFRGNNTHIESFIREAIIHCNYVEDYMIIEASSFLYLLLKLNQSTLGSVGKIRLQIITILSQLVDAGAIKKDVSLSRSFHRINLYALHSFSELSTRDLAKPSNLSDDNYASHFYSQFNRNVQELTVNLFMILKDTLKVNQLKKDGSDDMSISDLIYQISESYKNTPDLRVTWLKALSNLHIEQGMYTEAGMCYLHISALIHDFLQSRNLIEPLKKNFFTQIYPALKEFADDGEEGSCVSADFSVEGLTKSLTQAIAFLFKGEHYEYAALLYKYLTPIYEKKHAYRDLASSYLRLKDIWRKITTEGENRLYGTYFRAGFYGEKFQELNQKEFVYKQKKLTHLLEFNEKIKSDFAKIDPDLELADSSKNTSLFDPAKSYIQITFVEPHVTRTTRTKFEKNSTLSQFVYETPFTKSGKAHADSMLEQYKRKIILITKDSFPHMLSRLPIVRRSEIILTPIENAIENITKRNVLLETEVKGNAANNKTLQQLLQGSVRLQVNEGATAICKIFLGDYLNFPREHIEALCDALRNFLLLCRSALDKNKGFIQNENDKAFQMEMETGFVHVEGEMSYYLKNVKYEEKVTDSISESNEDETSETNSVSESGSPKSERRKKKSDRSRHPRYPKKTMSEDVYSPHISDSSDY